MDGQAVTVAVAAEYRGLRVPASPFLNPKRIERIGSGAYEGQEVAGALHVTRPGDRVLELGAGIGFVGGVVAAVARPARLLSFEANPRLIPHIRALHDLNGLGDIAEVRNQVLYGPPDRPERVTFHLHGSYLGSSLFDPGRGGETVEVETAPLAEVMAAFRPDVLLVDIEGGELDILRHADLAGVRAAVIEFHPDAYGIEGMRACKDILRAAGLVRVDDHSTRTVWTCARAEAQ
jgi:FkbM family methyltransferase